jgi:hypothetical protein
MMCSNVMSEMSKNVLPFWTSILYGPQCQYLHGEARYHDDFEQTFCLLFGTTLDQQAEGAVVCKGGVAITTLSWS